MAEEKETKVGSQSSFNILKNLVIPTSRKSLNRPEHKLTSENRNVLLVAATLIAAVTFQAGVSPPGGCWQDTTKKLDRGSPAPAPSFPDEGHIIPTKKLDGFSPPAPPGSAPAPSSDPDEEHVAGHAIYSSQRVPFHIFLICNTLSLSSSIFLLLCLTCGYPFFLEVVIASISMLVTYGSAIFAVTPDERVRFHLIFISAAGPIIIRSVISLISHIINMYSDSDSDNEAPKQGSKLNDADTAGKQV